MVPPSQSPRTVAPSPRCARLGLLLTLWLGTTHLGCVPALEPETGQRRPPAPAAEDPIVVLVSLDGFRWDYPELHGAPTLLQLAREGVRADGLIPIFPSKTFPNHYTVVTGRYAEGHGIVGNNMWDPVWDARFSLGNRDAVENGRWWEAEPIWVTAQKQGRVAATYFWPGSEAEITGVRPEHWKVFDDSIPGETRVDEVLGWLDLPDGETPSVITLYFSDTDKAGHDHGPEAPETAAAVARVDGYLARMVEGIEARGLEHRVNLIVTSDHGMAQMDPERVIVLEDYIDVDDVRIVDLSCIAMMRPEAGKEAEIVAALESASPHLHVYRKAEVPERFHYRSHRRITDLVAWSDPGWYIYATHAERRLKRKSFAYGMHGFDNDERDMHGIFVAWGPAFPHGGTTPPLPNVDVYQLMTEILKLDPAPNDGDPQRIASLLSGNAAPQSTWP